MPRLVLDLAERIIWNGKAMLIEQAYGLPKGGTPRTRPKAEGRAGSWFILWTSEADREVTPLVHSIGQRFCVTVIFELTFCNFSSIKAQLK